MIYFLFKQTEVVNPIFLILQELLQKLEQSADVADWFTLIEDAIKVQTAKPVCCNKQYGFDLHVYHVYMHKYERCFSSVVV